MRDAVILSAVRTAIGNFGGTLKELSAVELGVAAVKEALARANVPNDHVDEVLIGNVLQAGQGQNLARLITLRAGLPVEVPATTINKLCASGLKSVALAAQAIAAGEADLIVAGGVESMSRAPYLVENARWGCRMGHTDFVDVMMRDGLWDTVNDYHMGVTAENLADKYDISREEQDTYAAMSQGRCAQAMEAGKFRDEITPVRIEPRKGDPFDFDVDEFPKPATTAEALAELKPAFKKDGTVTAGNASGINDGAAAVVVASREQAERLGARPMATVRAYASAGVPPELMGIGPAAATRKALEKAKLSLSDIGLIEANEAFAVQTLAVARELAWDSSKVNVNGGAIALGHPIGASGARILATLLHEMTRAGHQLGLATLCIGGGMGMAMIVERD